MPATLFFIKKFNYLLLLFFLQLSCSSSQIELFKSCEEIQIRYYIKNQPHLSCSFYEIPFDTTSIVLRKIYFGSDTSKIMTEEKYLNQKLHGEYKKYRKSGNLKLQGYFIDGLRHGKWVSFDKDGDISTSILYNMGKENGMYNEYYHPGLLSKRGAYKHGKKIGKWVSYYRNGKIKSKEDYKVGSKTFYRENGDVEKTIRRLGEDKIEKIFYTPKNTILRKSIHDGGEYQELYRYDQFSELLIESHVHDFDTGLVNYIRYEDGIIQLKGSYLYSKNTFVNNFSYYNKWSKTGDWISYHNDGSIKAIEDWSDAVKEKRRKEYQKHSYHQRSYDNKDKKDGPYTVTKGDVIIEEGFYDDKENNGIRKRYNVDGYLTELSLFNNGELDSINTKYIWNTKLVESRESYKSGLKHGECIYYKKKMTAQDSTSETYISRISNYIDGKKNGKDIAYFENLLKREETYYVNGLKHGKQISYRHNSDKEKIRDISEYNMGLQIGEHIIYDSNDNVQYYWKYNNDGLITGDAIEYENNASSSPCGWEGDLKGWKHFLELTIKGKYVDGKKEGEWISYSLPDSIVNRRVYFAADVEVKRVNYHPNGQIHFQSNEDGGPIVFYYDNGQVQSETKIYNDLDGNEIKSHSTYTEEGIRTSYRVSKNKKMSQSIIQYPNGQLRSNNKYVNGVLVGKSIEYHSNGKLHKVKNYDNNGKMDGIQIVYDEDGDIKSKQRYRHGILDGPYLHFHKNGIVSMKRLYRNGKIIDKDITYFNTGVINRFSEYKHGEKTGKYYSNFKNGKVKESGNYINGKYDGKYYKYFENGNIRDVGQYILGKKNGEWVCYYSDGELMAKSEYNHGKRHGIRTEYNRDGNIKSKIAYEFGQKVNQ